MNEMTYFFSIVAALAMMLASISIWSRKALGMKVLALIVTVLFLPAAYASLTHLLGRPKPVALEWLNEAQDEATVIGSQMVEGEAIYLWLRLPDKHEPMAYMLPWSEQLARELHGAQREAEKTGSEIKTRKPFKQKTDDSEPMFYAEPQQAPPEKSNHAQPGPMIFESSRRVASR